MERGCLLGLDLGTGRTCCREDWGMGCVVVPQRHVEGLLFEVM